MSKLCAVADIKHLFFLVSCPNLNEDVCVKNESFWSGDSILTKRTVKIVFDG